jgi:hypothetical protein
VRGGTFLEMAQDLVHDAGAKAAFDADPDGFLTEHGFDGLTAADVTDAVGFVADTLPADAARQLTEPDGDGEGLARLAQLDPSDVGSTPETDFLDNDPSGELDLPDGGAGADEPDTGSAGTGREATMAANDAGEDDLDPDPVATHDEAAEDGGVARQDESEPQPGFGVGWEPGDADDVTAASPEFANLLDHPADIDLDVTHVPDLAFDATDPINEAITWADHDETAAHHADAVEHDAGHETHDGADQHHDGDHDGHLDLDL